MSRARTWAFLAAILDVILVSSPTVQCGVPKWAKAAIDSASGATYHEEASVAVILDDNDGEIGEDSMVDYHVRTVIVLLKPTGTDLAALQQWVTPRRTIKNARGWIVTSDGKEREIPKDNIYTVAASQAGGYYDDAQIFNIRPVGLAPGSFAVYEYDIEEKCEWHGVFDRLLLQNREPVRASQYGLKIPKSWWFRQVAVNADMCNMERDGERLVWKVRDLPYREKELSSIPDRNNYRQVLLACGDSAGLENPTAGTWRAAADWAQSLFVVPAEPTDTVRAVGRHFADSLRSRVELTEALANFVRRTMRYVAVEYGRGGLVPRLCGATLVNRYGDCKDKATLTAALLRSQNIHAVPVLVNPLETVIPDVPSPLQFNHVIVAIDAAGAGWIDSNAPAFKDNWLYFDPTAEDIPLGYLPISLYGTNGLMLSELDSPLVKLPSLSPDRSVRKYSIDASLDEQGGMTARVRVFDRGDWAFQRVAWQNRTEDKTEINELRAQLASAAPGAVVTNYESNADGDSAWVTFNVTAKSYLGNSGGLNLLTLDPFHGAQTKPLKTGPRAEPIWLGYPSSTDFAITWNLAPNWKIDGSYPLVEAHLGGSNVRGSVSIGDGQLTWHASSVTAGEILPTSQYETARAFVKTMNTINHMKVALKDSSL